MKGTAINWCNSTFNPWEGCTKISPGCANCFAKKRDDRQMIEPVSHWGPGAPRRMTSDSYWKQPLGWDREAAKAGTRPRIFCGSLCDWADDEAPAGQRDRLWDLIRQTPHLDWLMLTKRASNINKYLPADWNIGYANVWLGVTCENKQHGLPRLEALRGIPASVHFLSCEPLLEDMGEMNLEGIEWVIVGGETGGNARSMDVIWAEGIVEQCRKQGVPVWMKQLGKSPALNGELMTVPGAKGTNAENINQWPDDIGALQIRKLPAIDPDVIATGINEAELQSIEARLRLLAAELGSDEATQELELRNRFLGFERKLFLTRQERAVIVAAYKEMYSPIRKWTAFLRVVGMPRQTAYELLALASNEDAEANRTVSVQSPRTARPAKKQALTIADAVDRAAEAVKRVLGLLPEQDRAKALDELVERLASTYAAATADREAA